MDRAGWTEGAPPLQGTGPREGLPAGLVWPTRRRDAEGPSPWQTRSGAFRSVGAGWWVPADVNASVEQRIVEAAARLPAHGAVTGWAGLRWLGARWSGGVGPDGRDRPVVLALGSRHTRRPSAGIRVSQELVPAGHIRRARGLRVTSALWSVAFEMRKAPSEEAALVAFEMAAYDDLVSVAELAAFIDEALWIRQGVQRVRDLLPHLEENSWSPPESVMRRTWQLAGHGRPLANRPVFDRAGRFVGTPDLLDAHHGVYGQYDGALHLAGAVRHADVAKDAAYRALGLEGVTMLAGDLADRGPFCNRLREAYARAARRPADLRLWARELPAWWVPTSGVEQRRALSAHDATRLLAYRRAA
ncbi:hypothetical protein [Nocardioides sp. SYSU D00065]|uniref:hypothetical protein n=1 Tax=Nocardioides sp. SYSU D00065 TaxID=2817378 RepID=UPI001B32E7B2|nr:hypothetical protein [Nocardioides sp. SYSU D00065]